MISAQRRSPRYPFFASANIIEPRTGVHLTGRTSELSRHGCYLDMMNPLPIGSIIKVEIVNHEKTLESRGHEQDARARSARRMHELRDFFPAKNRRQAMGLFRIRSIGKAPGSAECLDIEKTQCCQTLRYRARRFSFAKQLRLIFANVSRA